MRGEPGPEDLEVLSKAEMEDALLLLQDGVYALDEFESDVPVYACEEDLELRSSPADPEVTVDYTEIVELLESHDLVVTL